MRATTLGDLVVHVRESVRAGSEPGARYVGLEHLSPGGLRLAGWGSAGEVKSETTRFSPGDLLFGRLRPQLRKAALAPFGGVCSPDILVLRPNDRSLSVALLHWLGSPWFVERASRSAGGTRMPRVSWGHLASSRVALPPRERLAEASERLSLLFRRAELARQIAASSFSLARALLAERLPGVARAIDGQGGAPAARGTPLGAIAACERKQLAPGSVAAPTPCFGLEHLPRSGLLVDQAGEAGQASSYKVRVRRGEVLFGRLRPQLRKAGLAPTGGVCSPDILVLRPASPELGPLLSLAARGEALFAHADRAATGTRMPRVGWEDLSAFTLPLPAEPALSAFASVAGPLFEQIVTSAAVARSADRLRERLVPELLGRG